MSLTRRLARPMLAGMFLYGGWDAFRNPESKAPRAEKVTTSLANHLGLPDDTATLVRVNAGVQLAAGSLLALNRLPRLAAFALAGTLVPTTLAGHRFWEETDKQVRAQQTVHFLKNVGMLGGLLLAVVDTGGKPSLSWRAARAAERARDALPALPTGD
jgi:uncharacterized membrane protein YphA (DoxX/SURF4 family)